MDYIYCFINESETPRCTATSFLTDTKLNALTTSNKLTANIVEAILIYKGLLSFLNQS